MIKYILSFILCLGIVQKVSGGLDAIHFHGLDEVLISKGIPEHLLPSGRGSSNETE